MSYNLERISELENEIKSKQFKLESLREEEQSLLKIEHEQSIAFSTINREGDYEERIYEMTNELRE